jgi:ABC-type iron transport system FetAB ATPase subunit
MLKRLLLAVALAASTLLAIGTAIGTATGTAQASVASVCASGQPNPGNCLWKGGCYTCYDPRSARWTVQYCDGDSEG